MAFFRVFLRWLEKHLSSDTNPFSEAAVLRARALFPRTSLEKASAGSENDTRSQYTPSEKRMKKTKKKITLSKISALKRSPVRALSFPAVSLYGLLPGLSPRGEELENRTVAVRGDHDDSTFRTMLVLGTFALLIYTILVVKVEHVRSFRAEEWFFLAYSFAVTFYVLSRLLIAYFYNPSVPATSKKNAYVPSVTFGIPSLNEEDNIYETIERIAASDYPKEKFDIVVIDDGSTDGTLREMKRAQKDIAKKYGVAVKVIAWKENRGKREGMAESITCSDKDIVVFIDSDSFVDPDTLTHLVKYFVDPSVDAVAGQAYVANADKNFLTKMQEVKYFVAFKAYKSAEAIFGSVTCCSGCCAAYRRSAIIEHVEEFTSQKFLGVQCTYGDDRSLTNIILKYGGRALFASDAISYTFAPDTMRQFLKQQMRWKKSWTRETLISSTFMWKRHPIMVISHFAGLILPLLAPFVVFRAMVLYPIQYGTAPYYYFIGIVLMSLVYGLYYYIYMRDSKWIYGVIFSILYTFLLVWQLPWAILNIRDPQWGTR